VTEIYISLLDEGTPVWRPVPATDLGAGVFEISAHAKPGDDERWEFKPGDHVICERRPLSGGPPVLVATKRVAAV
jgi:hypothetical protein